MRINKINKSSIHRKSRGNSPKNVKQFKAFTKCASARSFIKNKLKRPVFKKFNFKSFLEKKKKIDDGFFTFRQKANTISKSRGKK